MDRNIIELYSKPMIGGELPYFAGKQYGNGWLRSLGRLAFPILKKVAGVAANTVANTAEDVIMNEKKLLPSLKRNALAQASNIFKSNSKKPVLKRKRRTINNPNFPLKVRKQ